jgi:hypothetical protein
LAAPHLHGVLVLVTDNKFIAGVVVTGTNCSQVTTTPVINLSAVSTTPGITENPGKKIHWRSLKIRDKKFIAGGNDTCDKHSFANISTNFRKNSKRPQWNTWGPGGHRFMKKPEVKNLVSDSL